jgi:hypothetical protein
MITIVSELQDSTISIDSLHVIMILPWLLCIILLLILVETCSTIDAIVNPNFAILQQVIEADVASTNQTRKFRDHLRETIFKGREHYTPLERLQVSFHINSVIIFLDSRYCL